MIRNAAKNSNWRASSLTDRETRRFQYATIAVTIDFLVCSEFSAGAREEHRLRDSSNDSEFVRCSGSYKSDAMLQFGGNAKKRLELRSGSSEVGIWFGADRLELIA